MRFDAKKIAQYGLLTGIAILYFCLVGMVQNFDKRFVINDILSLGRAWRSG